MNRSATAKKGGKGPGRAKRPQPRRENARKIRRPANGKKTRPGGRTPEQQFIEIMASIAVSAIFGILGINVPRPWSSVKIIPKERQLGEGQLAIDVEARVIDE